MAEYTKIAQNVMNEVKKAVIGKDECVKRVMAGSNSCWWTYINLRCSGSWENNACSCIRKKYGDDSESYTIYTGCSSG